MEKKLGEGVYGTVYLCHDTLTDTMVAIKRHKEMPFDKQEGYNFSLLREINVLMELSRQPNSHLCQLIDVFQLRDGSACIVIELLKGGSVL